MKREDLDLSTVASKLEKLINEAIDEKEEKLKIRLIEGVKKIIRDYEEEIEDEQLSRQYESRLNLPENQWEKIPEGMTIGEWFREKMKESGNNNETK
jgi:hypothetical protein